MKIIFAGTPDFAVPALAALIEAGHQIVMVLTQPDRPAGRGMKLKASPVKVLAEQHHLNVYQPETLKDAAVQAHIEAANADVMIVAAYGLIIPTVVLNMPRFGCYNIHASLLPRWRGAAPIHRSILAGDAETGVTIMEVVPALDAGAMVSRGVVPITESDTTQTLHDALSNIGAELMVQAMATLEQQGTLPATQQDETLVTYAHKLEKSEAAIDWHKSAIEISRQVRAFNPFPVAQGMLKDAVCRIWMATAKAGKARAGEIVSVHDGFTVGCGEGLLHITELQAPGGKRLSAQAFVQGHNLQVGDLFT
ncbi:methionyl-tRNA formyltransferase [Methylotenera sp.]|uniref:methionyl-tRNA formyltransferase n=1 Tax=Methylotenera sp. TaxID=2051956 RepID=UPI0027317D2B|nr:methionyl-tRNA formyltransferase [Methylotenera sp.]MDP2231883.1 methionyl-tRNA formyltransferase [Methylotenera sp.]MDP3140982.1 methionyl-tRNA formyltransferase [Methylotenera sp.]